MKLHPLAGLFPKMSAADFIALKADIQLHGIIEPIWTKNQKIIDGRHRWRACQELKKEGVAIECPTREFSGDDILAFVISANIMRRQLRGQQKQAIIKKLLQVHPEQSNRSLAKMADVSDNTIREARAKAEANAQTAHNVERIETSGRKARGRKPGKTAAVTNKSDLSARRILKELTAIHPNELTDAQEFINELSAQLDRLQGLRLECHATQVTN